MEFCTFIFPAIIKEKDVVCSVSSGGKSPYVAQYVKSLIRRSLPCGIGEINDKMGDFRSYAKQEIKEAAARRAFLRKKFDELINGENPGSTAFVPSVAGLIIAGEIVNDLAAENGLI